MSEITYDLKVSNLDITSSLGIYINNNNSQLKHQGNGTFTIQSTSGKILIKSTSSASDAIKLQSTNGGILFAGSTTCSNLNISGNFTLTNSSGTRQYIYLNSDPTSTNHWRISVNSSGNLDFERYNGSSWISKSTIT